MASLNNYILMEVCLNVALHPENLRKFILVGNENSLACIRTFESVQECEINQDSAAITFIGTLFNLSIIIIMKSRKMELTSGMNCA